MSERKALKVYAVSSGALPVALRHARTRDPDFADFVRRAREHRLGMNDDDFCAMHRAAAADQRPHDLMRVGGGSDGVVIERGDARRAQHGVVIHLAAGNDQRRFGKPVAWIGRAGTEAARGEGLGKALQRVGADRFCPVIGDAPTAQVEAGALFGRNPARAHVIGEIGTTADGGVVARNRLNPSQGALKKRLRRHENASAVRCRWAG